jgi:hypothetical protein
MTSAALQCAHPVPCMSPQFTQLIYVEECRLLGYYAVWTL